VTRTVAIGGICLRQWRHLLWRLRLGQRYVGRRVGRRVFNEQLSANATRGFCPLERAARWIIVPPIIYTLCTGPDGQRHYSNNGALVTVGYQKVTWTMSAGCRSSVGCPSCLSTSRGVKIKNRQSSPSCRHLVEVDGAEDDVNRFRRQYIGVVVRVGLPVW